MNEDAADALAVLLTPAFRGCGAADVRVADGMKGCGERTSVSEDAGNDLCELINDGEIVDFNESYLSI